MAFVTNFFLASFVNIRPMFKKSYKKKKKTKIW